MLAKLLFLQKEEMALKDIDSKLSEQLTRLQQEELHLRSLLRESEDVQLFNASSSSALSKSPHQRTDITMPSSTMETLLDTVSMSSQAAINITPLEDLTVQPNPATMTMHMDVEVEEEEDGEDETEEQTQATRQCDDMGYNKELMDLMQQIQGGNVPHIETGEIG